MDKVAIIPLLAFVVGTLVFALAKEKVERIGFVIMAVGFFWLIAAYAQARI